MYYQHNIENCFQSAIGERGVTEDAFASLLQQIESVIGTLKYKANDNSLPLLTIADRKDDLAECLAIGQHIRDTFSDLIILGTGGSTLNPQALVGLRGCQEKSKTHTRIHFLDNIDSNTVSCLLDNVDLKNTAFLSISKSGSTLETVATTLVCLNIVEKEVGKANLGKHFFFITDPIDSPLRRIADKIGSKISNHEAGIGGRFSTLTNVGLIPAIVAGFDAQSFREGAAAIVHQALSGNYAESSAARGAAIHLALMQQQFNIAVFMPYLDRLSGFTAWHRQTWSESLGKKGVNTSYIQSAGTLDQHSQLQLYLDGPRNKVFTLTMLDSCGTGKPVLPEIVADKDTTYLHGKLLGDILEAEQTATADTLVRNQCPLISMRLQKLDEQVMGALFMHSQLEIIIMAGMLNINAFDQPAVEESKILTKKLLREYEAA